MRHRTEPRVRPRTEPRTRPKSSNITLNDGTFIRTTLDAKGVILHWHLDNKSSKLALAICFDIEGYDEYYHYTISTKSRYYKLLYNSLSGGEGGRLDFYNLPGMHVKAHIQDTFDPDGEHTYEIKMLKRDRSMD